MTTASTSACETDAEARVGCSRSLLCAIAVLAGDICGVSHGFVTDQDRAEPGHDAGVTQCRDPDLQVSLDGRRGRLSAVNKMVAVTASSLSRGEASPLRVHLLPATQRPRFGGRRRGTAISWRQWKKCRVPVKYRAICCLGSRDNLSVADRAAGLDDRANASVDQRRPSANEEDLMQRPQPTERSPARQTASRAASTPLTTPTVARSCARRIAFDFTHREMRQAKSRSAR